MLWSVVRKDMGWMALDSGWDRLQGGDTAGLGDGTSHPPQKKSRPKENFAPSHTNRCKNLKA